MFTWSVIQGQPATFTLTLSGGEFTGSEPLDASVSTGLTDNPIATFAPTWSETGPPLVDCVLSRTITGSLAPGAYVVQVSVAGGGGALAYGLIQVVASPSRSPLYDVLTTPATAMLLAPELADDAGKLAALPFALRVASNTIRRFCNRDFTRRDHVDYEYPSLEGLVRLREFPVNVVRRISRGLRAAVAIQAAPGSSPMAGVVYLSEDEPSPPSADPSFVGIVLRGGVGSPDEVEIMFSNAPALNDLVAAVNAVSGWSAKLTDASYGSLPTSELYCDGGAMGASSAPAELRVFSEDVRADSIDRRTGMVRLSRGRLGGGLGPRWGPDWAALDDRGDRGDDADLVRVAYNAGFTVIPEDVQHAAVELAKVAFTRINLDYAIKKESIGDYSYEFNEGAKLSIPDPVRHALAPYVNHQA